MSVYELAALAAASCWALASIISSAPAKHLGAFSFNHIRLGMVFIILLVIVLVTKSYAGFKPDHLIPILLSGFIGFF